MILHTRFWGLTLHIKQHVLSRDLRREFGGGFAVECPLVLGSGAPQDEAFGWVVGDLGPIHGDLLGRHLSVQGHLSVGAAHPAGHHGRLVGPHVHNLKVYR